MVLNPFLTAIFKIVYGFVPVSATNKDQGVSDWMKKGTLFDQPDTGHLRLPSGEMQGDCRYYEPKRDEKEKRKGKSLTAVSRYYNSICHKGNLHHDY